ncbi:hypothetical protein Mc24_04635 [Thermotoga sp. Mc24]|nr:hypothetical protein Mc24_04635 [Thermotoga sp. Mc24]
MYPFLETIGIYFALYLLLILFQNDFIEKLYIVPLMVLGARYGSTVQTVNVLMYYLFVLLLSENKNQFEDVFLHYVLIVSSIIVSLINHNHTLKIVFLEKDLKESRNDLENIRKYVDYLEDVIDKLKTKLIYESEGISSLLIELSNASPVDLKEFAYYFLEKISSFFEIKRSSFYLYKAGFMRLIASIGRPLLGFSASVHQSLVVKKAIKEGSCSIFDVLNQEVQLNKEPLLAVRVGEKDILGVITVEEVENPVHLNSIEKNLRALTVWFITRLEKVEEEIQKHKLPDGTYTVDFYNYTKQRLEELLTRYNLPFSEICISISEDEIEKIIKTIRSDDVVTRIKTSDHKIFLKILLPFCDEIGQIAVMERLKYVAKTIEFSSC